jgi:predicted acetyltransferase
MTNSKIGRQYRIGPDGYPYYKLFNNIYEDCFNVWYIYVDGKFIGRNVI